MSSIRSQAELGRAFDVRLSDHETYEDFNWEYADKDGQLDQPGTGPHKVDQVVERGRENENDPAKWAVEIVPVFLDGLEFDGAAEIGKIACLMEHVEDLVLLLVELVQELAALLLVVQRYVGDVDASHVDLRVHLRAIHDVADRGLMVVDVFNR